MVVVAGLGNIDIVQRILGDDGELLGGGPLPVGDRFRDFHVFEFLFLSHVEDLHHVAVAVSAGLQGDDVLVGVHDGVFGLVGLAGVAELERYVMLFWSSMMVRYCSPLGRFSLADKYWSDSRLTTPNLKLWGDSSKAVSLVISLY